MFDYFSFSHQNCVLYVASCHQAVKELPLSMWMSSHKWRGLMGKTFHYLKQWLKTNHELNFASYVLSFYLPEQVTSVSYFLVLTCNPNQAWNRLIWLRFSFSSSVVVDSHPNTWILVRDNTSMSVWIFSSSKSWDCSPQGVFRIIVSHLPEDLHTEADRSGPDPRWTHAVYTNHTGKEHVDICSH